MTRVYYDSTGAITAVRTIGRGSSYNTTTTYTYDGSGNLVRLEEPGGRSYNFSYDAQGNHVATIDSHGIAMSRTYDSGNRVLTETVYSAPQSSSAWQSGPLVTRNVYDAAGRLRFQLSPAGNVTEYLSLIHISPRQFQALLARSGVNTDSTVVLYGDNKNRCV